METQLAGSGQRLEKLGWKGKKQTGGSSFVGGHTEESQVASQAQRSQIQLGAYLKETPLLFH